MAAANESQGLKIAVAVFVTFTVVFAVTTYFAYTSYSQASAKQAEAESATSKAVKEAQEEKSHVEYLKDKVGYGKVEDFNGLTDAIKKDDDRFKDEKLKEISDNVTKLVEEYRTSGGREEKVNELAQSVSQLIAQIKDEPNQNYTSVRERMATLVDNMAQLSTMLVRDNQDLRVNLGSADETNAKQLQVQIDALEKSKKDLEDEHRKHEDARADLVRKNDDLTTKNSQQATEIARLNQLTTQLRDDFEKERRDLRAQMSFYREATEKTEQIMDVPDGKITFVDYGRSEVQTDLTRGMGAHERLQFSVFDKNSPGLPTDHPKGIIELIRVGDQNSLARIVKTMKPSEPIRPNDLVYSAAWDRGPDQMTKEGIQHGRPQRFALIGKIDVDRNGRDDRADLKRMIEAAGGKIDYDLPPPGIGKETGQITGLTTWFVTDSRDPFRPDTGDRESTDKTYLTKKTEALRKARDNGVRPIQLERLLAQFGYIYGTPIPGRVEAIDKPLSEDLTRPVQRRNPAPTPPKPDATTTPPAAGGAEEPKDEGAGDANP